LNKTHPTHSKTKQNKYFREGISNLKRKIKESREITLLLNVKFKSSLKRKRRLQNLKNYA